MGRLKILQRLKIHFNRRRRICEVFYLDLGDVIKVDDKHYVVTEISNGQVTTRVLLEDFVSANLVIMYDGEYRTIKDVIQIHCEKYINERA